jgi:protein TonB
MSPVLDQYNFRHESIKVALFFSLIFHLLIVLIIFVVPYLFGRPKLITGPVYTVNLVDMPSRGIVGPTATTPPTAGSISIPNPKPIVSPPKDIKQPKIKEIKNVPVIKPLTSEPKPVIKVANIPKPSIQGLPGKENIPGGPVLGAVKGATNNSGASTPGINQSGSVGSNIPGAIAFPDPYYLQIIQTKVTGNWQPPQGILGRKKELTMMVYFAIDRKGNISEIQVENSSGSMLLDQSATRAVQLTNPLPPLPSVVKEEILRVHFRFTYTS